MDMKMDKILAVFIREPEAAFHVRALAKILGKSPTTISQTLKSYVKKGVLISEKKLHHLFFKADTQSRAYKKLKLMFNLSSLYESGILEYLEDEFHHPEALGVFGSYAKAEDTPQSDVDLFVVSPLKKELALEKYEKKLERKIQVFMISRKEIDQMKEKNKELLNAIINGIVLLGSFEVFR